MTIRGFQWAVYMAWSEYGVYRYIPNLFPLPSGYVKIAIENGHRNSGFSQLQNGDFPIAM